VKASETEAPSI